MWAHINAELSTAALSHCRNCVDSRKHHYKILLEYHESTFPHSLNGAGSIAVNPKYHPHTSEHHTSIQSGNIGRRLRFYCKTGEDERQEITARRARWQAGKDYQELCPWKWVTRVLLFPPSCFSHTFWSHFARLCLHRRAGGRMEPAAALRFF